MTRTNIFTVSALAGAGVLAIGLATQAAAAPIETQTVVPVTATVSDILTITAPTSIPFGNVSPGTIAETAPFNVNILTNRVGYSFSVASDTDSPVVPLAIKATSNAAGAAAQLPNNTYVTLSQSTAREIGTRPSSYTSETGDDWGLRLRGTFPWTPGGAQQVGALTFIASVP